MSEIADDISLDEPVSQSFAERKKAPSRLRKDGAKSGPNKAKDGSKKATSESKKDHKETNGEVKKHRFHPGTVAAREVRKAQKKETLDIPRTRIENLIREIIQEGVKNDPKGLRISSLALNAIHVAVEAELANLNQAMQLVATTEGLQTIMPKHLDLLRALYTNFDLRALLLKDPRPIISAPEMEVLLAKMGTTADDAHAKYKRETVTRIEAYQKMILFKCYDMDPADLAKVAQLPVNTPDLPAAAYDKLIHKKNE